MQTRKRPRTHGSLRRLVLRPGTHVLRRSATELQVGLDPRRAVVLPDLPEVRALLDALRSPATGLSEAQYAAPTLAQLAGSGLLVDADVLLPLAPALPVRDTVPDPESHSGRHHNARPHDTGPARQTISRTDVAALATVAGDRVPALLEARSRARVEVVSSGSREAHALAGELVGLLSGAGMRPNLLAHGQSPAAATAHSPEPLAGVLVCVGEPPREAVDAWMRAGTPHLLLRLTEGHAVIGPFVLPGETACLRCLDAHHTDVDPAWPLLVTQYASAVTREREDTVPEPVDALLAAIACAWAAREIVSHAEGRRPATASATVGLDPHLTALETHCWPRHPDCGCGWA